MKDTNHKHTQFELFPGTIGHSIAKENSRIFLTSLRIPVENLFVLAVVLIMGLVVAFSLGVERGKNVARQPQPSSVVMAQADLSGLLKAQEAFAQGKSNVSNLQTTPSDAVASSDNASAVASKEMILTSEPAVTAEKELDISDKKLYTVQVASYKQEKYAQQAAQNLRIKEYEIFVVPKGKYSIVCVGKFSQRDDAQTVSKKLKKQFSDCLIRSL